VEVYQITLFHPFSAKNVISSLEALGCVACIHLFEIKEMEGAYHLSPVATTTRGFGITDIRHRHRGNVSAAQNFFLRKEAEVMKLLFLFRDFIVQ